MPENQIQSPQPKQNPYLIPLSIVVGFAMVAAAIFFSGGNISFSKKTATSEPLIQKEVTEESDTTNQIRPVTAEDHIKGDPNARVKIVEFSDYECPFCKRFHETMNTVMEKYVNTKDVAWVYRHFPLEQLHPKNAMKVAIASECAAEQGGDEMFWKFTDRWFELTPTNDRTDLLTVLPQIYKEIGVDQVKMESCMVSGRYDEHIKSDFENAIATGGKGTPWSVVVAANGMTFPVSGALPIETVEQLIEVAKAE